MLGAQPGVLDGGEMALFWRDAARGNTCACGEPLTSCELWGAALRRVQTELGVTPSDYQALARERARISRTTRPLRLIAMRRKPATWTASEQRLIEATSLLIDAALDEAGAEVLVDTSKTLPALLFQQLTPQRPLTLVHLIRDARAVVASTVRSRAVVRGNDESLPPGGSLTTAIGRWLWSNLTATIGRRMLRTGRKVRYEALMASPEAVVRSICQDAGIAYDPATLVGDELRSNTPSHAAVGNPRRGAAVTQLVADERWRTELPRSSQHLVRAATWPLDTVLR